MYEETAALLARVGFEVYVPHLSTDPVRHSHIDASGVYATDRRQVTTSDLVVAFVTRPSIGVGQELEIAAAALVPVLLVAESLASVSRMALGGPARTYGPIRYSDSEDLRRKLDEALPSIVSELRAKQPSALPDIGSAISRARTRSGMARREMAERVGVSETYLELVETSDARVSNPSFSFLIRAAAVCGMRMNDLLGWSSQETPLLASLREYASARSVSFRTYAALERMAARGLRPDRILSPEEWERLHESASQAAGGVEQLELITKTPNDDDPG